MGLFVRLVVCILACLWFASSAGAQDHGSVALLDLQEEQLVFANVSTAETTVIQFWATWCKQCESDFPKLFDLAQQFPAVHFLAVAVEGTPQEVQKYVEKKKVPFETYVDATNEFARLLKIQAVPVIAVYDARKNLLKAYVGYGAKNQKDLKLLLEQR